MAYYHCPLYGRSEITRATSFSSDLNPLHSSSESTVIRYSGFDDCQKVSDWKVYFEIVRKYSRRKLTYSSDALAAFAGIMAALGSRYSTRFLAGLPVSALLTALHWVPGYHEVHPGGWIHEDSSPRRAGFPSWAWASRDGPFEWLDCVVLTEWWELEILGQAELPASIELAELDSSAKIRLYSQISSIKGLSAKLCTTLIFAEKIMDPEMGRPMPLVKLFDNQDRWCGRICYSSSKIMTNLDPEKLGLILLSTSAARQCHTQEKDEYAWGYIFDTSEFSVTEDDGKLARLCNLLLIEYVEGESAERRALCQIHADMWETMERKEEEVVLI